VHPAQGPQDQKTGGKMKFIRLGMLGTIFLFLLTPLMAAENPYVSAGIEAAQWVRASATKTGQGAAWPADPRDPKSTNNTLYSGVPGDVLLFVEAFHATKDHSYLNDARSGADYLLASIGTEEGFGLYEGLAGVGFALTEIYKATGDTKYKEGALKCFKLVQDRAVKAGKGIEWSDSSDIISGTSGIGLAMLYAARELKYPSAIETATQAGDRMLELGQPAEGGLKWAMSPNYQRLMPNFSHGTAGVAYFLASLYQQTKKKEFLEGALAGAKYLLAVAKTEGDVCMVFHNEPDGKDLYYLGWCHGPVGTARLFYRLYQVTGDKVWMSWVKKSARAILTSGIPEKQTPGFWNNVGRCCGSAGVAEFFLDLYRVTKDREYLAFSKRVTDQVISRGTREGQGMKWIQAEHRVRPELLVAQTGLMQGASGIGLWLFKLGSFERGKMTEILLPDTPF
jgi:lantibiotic modifying enzyme